MYIWGTAIINPISPMTTTPAPNVIKLAQITDDHVRFLLTMASLKQRTREQDELLSLLWSTHCAISGRPLDGSPILNKGGK